MVPWCPQTPQDPALCLLLPCWQHVLGSAEFRDWTDCISPRISWKGREMMIFNISQLVKLKRNWTSNGQFVPLEPWFCFVLGLVFLAEYIKIALSVGMIMLPKEIIKLFILDNIWEPECKSLVSLLWNYRWFNFNTQRPVYFWDLFLAARDLIKNLSKKRNNI